MNYTDYEAYPTVERNYKDTVFRMLFQEKAALLSLYNAVNKTSFTNVEDLEITTLENAVYMGMKNDVSCVFAFELSLYEHQSTVNPNMPLRDLFYVAPTRIRKNRKSMELQTAVNTAVDDCIRDGILAEFLTAQRAEVVAMSIFEYDQEKHIKQEKEESWEDGYNEGMERGMEAGRAEEKQRMLRLLQKMGENDELHLTEKLQDEVFLSQMYEKYEI